MHSVISCSFVLNYAVRYIPCQYPWPSSFLHALLRHTSATTIALGGDQALIHREHKEEDPYSNPQLWLETENCKNTPHVVGTHSIPTYLELSQWASTNNMLICLALYICIFPTQTEPSTGHIWYVIMGCVSNINTFFLPYNNYQFNPLYK